MSRPPLPAIAAALALSSSSFAIGCSQSPETASGAEGFGPGTIVESVTRWSQGERAGLREGDVIVGWTRGNARGDIHSPFDLFMAETEQAPYGAVTLTGRRGGQEQQWKLGPGAWRIDARPDLPPALRPVARQSRKLARQGKLAEAAAGLRRAAAEAGDRPVWLGPWLLAQAAGLVAASGQAALANTAYGEALQRAARAPLFVGVRILDEWSDTFDGRTGQAAREKFSEAALAAVRSAGAETLTSAAALHFVAWVTSTHGDGDHDRAEALYQRALAIRQRLAPGSFAVASSFKALGVLWEDRDPEMSEGYHRRSIDIFEKVAPASLAVAWGFNNLGVSLLNRGELASAEQALQHALAIAERGAPDDLRANLLHNLGFIAIDLGNLKAAEQRHRAALKIRETRSRDSAAVAESLHHLGMIAEARGDLDQAEHEYRRALALREKLLPESFLVALTLNNLGMVARKRGDLDQADALLERALAIKKQRVPGTGYIANALTSQAEVAEERSDWARVEALYDEALETNRRVTPGGPHTGATLAALGRVARARGDLSRAQRRYQEALSVLEKVAPGTAGHADALAGLAAVNRDQGKNQAAAALLAQTLAALEHQITRLGGSDEVRAGFRAERAQYYRAYIDLLQEQRRPEQAFEVAERLRAQSLLEMLAAAHVQLREGADGALLERERGLQALVAAKTDLRLRLLGKTSEAQRLAAVTKEIDRLLAEYRQVQEEIRTSSPRYAAVTQPRPLGAREVRRQLLDADTVLLEYALGDERSYLWAMTARGLTSYVLPKRSEIEAAARHLYQLLTARNAARPGESEGQRRVRLDRAIAQYPDAAAAVSRLVLEPAAAALRARRLLIVSDGLLQYIPFAVLPVPDAARSGGGARPGPGAAVPLVLEHEIIHLPSASVVAAIRRETARRTPPPRTVAVIADPVFDDGDGRVAAARAAARSAGLARQGDAPPPAPSPLLARLTRSAAELGLGTEGGRLQRLRFTRREADSITAVMPPGQWLKALDFDASRATATSAALQQYRIVHFATHGMLDSRRPELSGLVLSLVDQRGAPQDGFLGLEDIYNLKLAAELVVLSGCETGLGKAVDGEGLIGLTRGFMYAGAAQVMASLWKVDDLSTAELMGRFYQALQGRGLRPAAALREAQIAMSRQSDSAFPYHWGAFQIQGDWR